MKSLEESVVIAMDGSDTDLFPFFHYILQDIWEIGTDPEAIIRLISKHCSNFNELRILDLGCGKGAVSVKLALKLGCFCHGIDAIPEFIAFAREKAMEYELNHLCRFETGDIRKKVKNISGYDVVILGAIGPVFGDYFSTLSTLSPCITDNGIFIIDDSYIDDESDFSHPYMFRKTEIIKQIGEAGMKLIEDDIIDRIIIKESDDFIYQKLRNRCMELIEKYPHKQNLFLNYIEKQEMENNVIETLAIGSTLVIVKQSD